MKNFNKIVILFLLIFISCSEDFSTVNTNPNSPTEVEPSLLLRQVIYNYGEEMSYEGFVAGNLLGQYLTQIDFNLFDRHSLRDPQFGGNPWPVLYKNLRDVELILSQSRSNTNKAIYEGPALILKSYMVAALTDIYGDVPYFEAFQGMNGIVTPKYDSQELIYTAEGGVIDNLVRAKEVIEAYTGSQKLEGDILFSGNLDAWIRFANSLIIKAEMRISDRIFPNHLVEIFFEGQYINSNDQNATFDFTDGQPNNFRMANLRDGDFNLFVMSETADEILTNLNDSRISSLYRPAVNGTNTDLYIGLLNGPDASQTSISVADYSLASEKFRESTSQLNANFMTAWETSFLLAEAAMKGFIFGNAKALYEKGVREAFDYWDATMPTDYLESGDAAFAFGAQNSLEQIITQKWIANSINGYESWIEYRRTGFPNLKPISASLNENKIPVRMPYPADEEALNNANYLEATNNNQNSVNANVWWDLD